MITPEQPKLSAYLRAIAQDNSLPIEQAALDLWLKDLQNPLRWSLRPLLQFVFAILLHLIWLFKRLPLPQFSAHNSLQRLICWFCRHFVSKEANLLILRHYATESNVLNFLAANSPDRQFEPVQLYPKNINDMLAASFVEHDQQLFRLFAELGSWQPPIQPLNTTQLNWQHWQSIDMQQFQLAEKRSQWLDFETSGNTPIFN